MKVSKRLWLIGVMLTAAISSWAIADELRLFNDGGGGYELSYITHSLDADIAEIELKIAKEAENFSYSETNVSPYFDLLVTTPSLLSLHNSGKYAKFEVGWLQDKVTVLT